MKSLKERIQQPFLLLVLGSSILLLVLFNLVIGAGANYVARQQLIEAYEIGDVYKPGLFDTTYSVEVKDGIISSTFKDEIAQNSYELTRQTSKTVTFRVAGIQYYAIKKDLNNENEIIYISSSESLLRLRRILNLILISILLMLLVIIYIVSSKLANKMARPIVVMNAMVKEIGNGHYLKSSVDQSSYELHELTRNVNEMSRKLKENDATYQLFIQNASHELRTPLMSIQGYLEGVEHGVFNKEEAFTIILDESKRLSKIVDNLMLLSQLDQSSPMVDTIDIGEVLEGSIDKILGYAHQENIRIETSLLKNCFALGNEDMLHQAFINILSNGIRYANKTVYVSMIVNECIEISIHDDGPGIAEEDMSHIFERFYKGKNGKNGLGLVIAENAIKKMDGSIQVKNDRGANFTIYLPTR